MSGRLIVNGSSLIVHRLIIFFLSAIFLLAIINYLLPIAHAQTPGSSPSATIPYTLNPIPSTVSPTSPLYTDLILHNMFHSFSCLAIGSSVIGQPCLTYQLAQNAQGAIQGVPILSSANLSGGLLGTTTGLIAGLYMNPPVRTVDYLASVGEGLGVVKPVHAQVVGSGAAVLNPIIKLWQVSRNIAYLIMIIIFVIIGLMVMFRQRINPQTVITAQAALPGLVIGLIMITFSFFLAGLVSDMAFVGTNVVGYYFSIAQLPNDPPQNLVADISNQSIITLFSGFAGIIDAGDGSHFINLILQKANDNVNRFLRFAAGVFTFQVANQIGHAVPIIGDIVGPIVGLASSFGTSILPDLALGQFLSWIATAILIYSMFKLLLRLINNYLSIIFLTVTAPFQFLAASLPGRQGIATAWILNMLCNILAFPAVAAVLYFVAYLLGPAKGNQPPVFNITGQAGVIGGNTLPFLGGLDTQFINLLLAFGALVALPAIPDIICRTIGRVGVAGQLIGQEIGASTTAGRGYYGQTQQRFFGAGSSMAQDYARFRGAEPTYAPAKAAGWRDWPIFGRKPFGRRA